MPIYIKTIWFSAGIFSGGSLNLKKEEQKVNEALKDIQAKNATVKDIHIATSGTVAAYLIVYEAPEPIT